MQDWELEQIKLAARESWEDEDVADSWDAEEEQEEAEEEVEPIAPVKPNKKAAALVKPSQDATSPPPPQETDQARKERLNRLIQESDLENAMALFGISKSEINVDQVLEITKKDATTTPVSSAPSVDGGYFESVKPQTWTEFETLSNTVVKKLKSLESSKHYPNFLESLFRALLNDRDVPEMRKLANMASELVSAKQRDKLSQMNGKKKVAPSLAGASKKNGRADMMDFGSNDDDDFDGF